MARPSEHDIAAMNNDELEILLRTAIQLEHKLITITADIKGLHPYVSEQLRDTPELSQILPVVAQRDTSRYDLLDAAAHAFRAHGPELPDTAIEALYQFSRGRTKKPTYPTSDVRPAGSGTEPCTAG